MADPHLLATDLTVTSIGNVNQNYTGTPVPTSIYTRHSYQVITSQLPASGHFRVLVSNQKGENAIFSTIADYEISSTNNAEGLLYCDTWNFLQARAELTGVAGGRFTVIENHTY